MQKFTFLKFWFLLTIVATTMSGLVYLTAQQSLRHSANDPQIQIAEDVARALQNGKQPSDFNTTEKIDMGKSLSTFVTIYDNQGIPVAGTGQLNNNLPSLPSGVFQFTKSFGEDRVTWQPESELRFALVIVHYTNGFVAVGRSMREVEIRENRTFQFVLLAWLATIFTTLVVAFVLDKIKIFN